MFFPLLVGANYRHVYYAEAASIIDPVRDGFEVQIHLPIPLHVKNFAVKGKGACVFTSGQMNANWHAYKPLYKMASKIDEGGGWPAKVDDLLKRLAPDLPYVQYEGVDPSGMEEALAEGRGVCATYGYGERYDMETIYHMVFLVHLDSEWAVIIDNNFPGTWERMPRDEFLRRWKHPGGEGWYYTFLLPPPPPIPHN